MSGSAKRFWLASGCAVLIAAVVALCLWWSASSRHDDAPVAAVEQEHQIWIEACRPLSVRQPLEVAGIGEHGEKGLCCSLGGTVAMEDEGGDAVYRFYVPATGRYRLWGYCCWLETEGDGFVADIGGIRSVIHRTASTPQWQWLPFAEAQLLAGVATMTLTAEGGGFAIRRMFLCNNLDRKPTESLIEPIDIFFDDFDGCQEGEFDSWSRVSGQWSVHRRQDDKRPASKVLVGKSSSEAIISVGSPNWRGYSFMLDCRAVSASGLASTAVRFYCDQEGNGLVLRWTPEGTDGQVRMELLREEPAGIRTIDCFAATWATSRWSELSVEASEGTLRVGVDSRPIRTIKTGDLGSGGIGLWLSGDVEVMFDNVQITGWRPRNPAAPREGSPSDNQCGQQDREVNTHDGTNAQ
jgi:hypothetical protein